MAHACLLDVTDGCVWTSDSSFYSSFLKGTVQINHITVQINNNSALGLTKENGGEKLMPVWALAASTSTWGSFEDRICYKRLDLLWGQTTQHSSEMLSSASCRFRAARSLHHLQMGTQPPPGPWWVASHRCWGDPHPKQEQLLGFISPEINQEIALEMHHWLPGEVQCITWTAILT